MADFSALKAAIQAVIKQNGNQEITGPILQEVLLSMVNTMGDGAINSLASALSTEITNRQNADGTLQQGINSEASTRGNADTTLQNNINSEANTRSSADTALQNAINAIHTQIDNGYVYAGIATPSTSPATGKVFYIAVQAGTYTNFGSTIVTEGITILKFVGSSWVKEQLIYADGGVFDITAYNGGTTYANLSAALGNNGANIPEGIRKGGMSVKYVQSSDNKYVQFRLMADAFTTDVTQWQGVDDEPTAASNNLVKSEGVYKEFVPKLQGVTANATPATINTLTDVHNGHVQEDGSILVNTGQTQYVVINVTGFESVRFLGLSRQTGISYYAFYDTNDTLIGLQATPMETGQPTTTFKEYIAKVPSNAVYFKTIYKSSAKEGLPEKFYCYLETGYPAASTFNTGEFIGDFGIDNVPTKNSTKRLVESGNTYKYLQRFAQRYAVVRAQIPEFDNLTFKLPAGTQLLGSPIYNSQNNGIITLPEDVIFNRSEQSGTTFNVAYLILNYETFEKRQVQYRGGNIGGNDLVLGDKEVLIALVRWTEGVFEGNFLEYKNAGITLTNWFKKQEYALKYAFIREQYPELDTTAFTFKLPAGTNISGNPIAGYGGMVLSEDVVWSRSELVGTTYNVVYLILNISTLAKRQVRYIGDESLILADNEVLIALLRWNVGILEGNFFEYKKNGNIIAFKGAYIPNVNSELTFTGNPVSGSAIITGLARKMFNPLMDLKKTNIKILDIGNSYTDDSTHYIKNIFESMNIAADFSIYEYYRGGASFKTIWDCYYDRDNVRGYTVKKVVGNNIQTVTEGEGAAGDGSLFRSLLQDTAWDVIVIHQASTYAVDYSQWQTNGDGGRLNQLINILRLTNPQASLGSVLIHSYAHDYDGNTEHSTILRWDKIAHAIMQFTQQYGIDFIIPYGTAVECLRQSTLNDGSDFSTDGTHMADGIGDYVASCVYYQSVLAPRLGVSIIGNTWRKTDFDTTQRGVFNIDNTNAFLAQKAALWATYNWYQVVNADNL